MCFCNISATNRTQGRDQWRACACELETSGYRSRKLLTVLLINSLQNVLLISNIPDVGLCFQRLESIVRIYIAETSTAPLKLQSASTKLHDVTCRKARWREGLKSHINVTDVMAGSVIATELQRINPFKPFSQAFIVQDGPLAFLFGVSWSHTYRHAVGLLWTSDQPVAEASTYTGQHNI
jgi:hypothetical protein